MNEGAAIPPTCEPCASRGLFDQAANRYPDEWRAAHFRVLGRGVHLQVVGRRLHGHLSAALAHLAGPAVAGTAGDLHICLWDEEVTAIPHPDGALSGIPDDDETVTVSADQCRVFERRGQWAVALNRPRREIVGSVRLAAARPLLHDLGKPLQTLMAVWARDLDVPLAHAGLVARDGRGILLGGPGGAGKSTTALACVANGFDFLGDDRVGLEKTDSAFIGHSLYNSVLLERAQLDRFPALIEGARLPVHPLRERKPLVFLEESYPQCLPPSARIQVLGLPRVTGGRASRARPARRAEALRVIAPSSLILPVGPGALGMRRLAELLRHVPCFWLDLGSDLGGVAACIERVLEAGDA